VTVQLPPVWAERPAVWFAQAEAQFYLVGISSDRTKFLHVISQLDQRHATEVEDIITSPTERAPHTTLRAELAKRLSPSTGSASESSSRLRRSATVNRLSSSDT
jgi:hypothetical protein